VQAKAKAGAAKAGARALAPSASLNVAPTVSEPAAAKKAPAQKKSAAAGGGAAKGGAGAAAAGGRAIEEIYQKKSQLEHILLRPDTYIGSTEKQAAPMWVCEGGQLVHKTITYAPGLFKIFDEILVNAADNKVRDPSMDTLRVDICAVRLGLGVDEYLQDSSSS
jgi:DNA topoisomerase II